MLVRNDSDNHIVQNPIQNDSGLMIDQDQSIENTVTCESEANDVQNSSYSERQNKETVKVCSDLFI
jgi:hypothetical protein